MDVFDQKQNINLKCKSLILSQNLQNNALRSCTGFGIIEAERHYYM